MPSSDIIKPVYFPFTTVSETAAQMLDTCFSAWSVYILSDAHIPPHLKAGIETERVTVRFPARVDQKILASVVQDFQAWTDQHGGGVASYLKHRDNPPFFDETATAQVVKDIRDRYQKGGDVTSPVRDESGTMLQRALFLHTAATFDLQSDDITGDIQRFQAIEKDFIADLREEDDAAFMALVDDDSPGYEDTGAYMTRERLAFWYTLVSDDLPDSGLYITSSSAVFSHLLDGLPDAVPVLEWGAIPLVADDAFSGFREDLDGILRTLMQGPPPDAPVKQPDSMPRGDEKSPGFFIDIRFVPGPPSDVLSAMAGGSPERTATGTGNTLIGHLRPVF